MGPRISRRAGARVRALAASIHSSLLFQSLPLPPLGKKKPVLVPWEAGVPGICQEGFGTPLWEFQVPNIRLSSLLY